MAGVDKGLIELTEVWGHDRRNQCCISLLNVFLCVHFSYVSFYTQVVLICVFLGSLMNSRYRRALSNNCTEGTLLKYSPRRQKCPSQAPRGLQLFTSEGTLVATLGRNVTFLVFLEEVLTSLKQSNSSVYYRVILGGCMLFL